jgi:diacylglycerol kinase
MHKNHPLAESIGYALEGLKFAFIEGRNFKIQIGFGVLTIILGFVLKISPAEWAGLVAIISMVLILELINTTIETVVDMVSLKFHPLAKIAKDVAAGAVLVAAIASVAIGALIFLPKIF